MVTDEERREVARRLRELAGKYVTLGELESILGIALTSGKVDICRDAEDLNRLADLIEPSAVVHECVPGECPINVRPSNADGLDLDAILRTCHELMEWCDGPEWTLCSTIYDAVLTYVERIERPDTVSLADLFGIWGDAERRAGEWNRRHERTCRNEATDPEVIFDCSECLASFVNEPIDGGWNYCPNCGARVL